MQFSEWKDDEYQYIINLLASYGNTNVPKKSIPSYIEVQIYSARIDSQSAIASALVEVARLIHDLTLESLDAAKQHMIYIRQEFGARQSPLSTKEVRS